MNQVDYTNCQNISVLTTTATSQLPQATVLSGITGSCPSGFVQCVDGSCEPFDALCGEAGTKKLD